MNDFNQIFQVTAPDLKAFQFSRAFGPQAFGPQSKVKVEEQRGLIAPGSFVSLPSRGSIFFCAEMTNSLEFGDSEQYLSLGNYYPFIVLNFSVKEPCPYNFRMDNHSNNPVDYSVYWAKGI
jgi:hypothetical protein